MQRLVRGKIELMRQAGHPASMAGVTDDAGRMASELVTSFVYLGDEMAVLCGLRGFGLEYQIHGTGDDATIHLMPGQTPPAAMLSAPFMSWVVENGVLQHGHDMGVIRRMAAASLMARDSGGPAGMHDAAHETPCETP